MEAQRKNPNVRTGAYLDFAWLVANNPGRSLLDEAIEALKEFGGEEAWPIARFKYFGVLAIIHAAKGNLPLASRHAKNALAAMDAKESGFRYHRNLGLVRDVEHTIIKRLIDLAAS